MGDVSSDMIGSVEAARILEITPGRVNQLKSELGGVLIGTVLVFKRADVVAFAKRPRTPGWKKGRPRNKKGKGKKK